MLSFIRQIKKNTHANKLILRRNTYQSHFQVKNNAVVFRAGPLTRPAPPAGGPEDDSADPGGWFFEVHCK